MSKLKTTIKLTLLVLLVTFVAACGPEEKVYQSPPHERMYMLLTGFVGEHSHRPEEGEYHYRYSFRVDKYTLIGEEVEVCGRALYTYTFQAEDRIEVGSHDYYCRTFDVLDIDNIETMQIRHGVDIDVD